MKEHVSLTFPSKGYSLGDHITIKACHCVRVVVSVQCSTHDPALLFSVWAISVSSLKPQDILNEQSIGKCEYIFLTAVPRKFVQTDHPSIFY